MRKSSLFFLFFFIFQAYGQDTLSFKQYLDNISEYHPLIKTVNNKTEIVRQQLRSAKGAFDPKISGDWNLKDYKDKDYFDIRGAKLKVPTTLGLDLVGKYERNTGLFLNQERTVPDNGLLGVGVEVPLIRGMFTDENRQALRAYKIKRDWQVVLNDSSYNQIFYSAIYDYVLWSVANQNIEVAHDLILIREQRYENVVKQYRGGFSSPLDTLDAFSQLQAAERSLLEAETKALKAKYQAANHIWNDLLNDKIETLSPEGIDNVIEYLNRLTSRDFDLNNHNFITSYQFNIKSLQTERALWREMMKPALDISLMSLSGPVTDFETINSFSTSNYLVGFNVEIPLNIRKAHGKVRALSLKMENMELKRQLKAREVMNKWLTVIATTNLQQEQYEVMSANASNLVRIRDLEEQRFNLGESSLFKLNSREDKMFEAQAKRLKSAEQYAQVQLNQLLYLQVLTPERLRSN